MIKIMSMSDSINRFAFHEANTADYAIFGLRKHLIAWEILRRRAAAEALWRAGGYATQDDSSP